MAWPVNAAKNLSYQPSLNMMYHKQLLMIIDCIGSGRAIPEPCNRRWVYLNVPSGGPGMDSPDPYSRFDYFFLDNT
jgi:hypothetical protein